MEGFLLVFMVGKLKTYFPIFAVMLITCATGVWAVVSVMPREAHDYLPIIEDSLNSPVSSDGYDFENDPRIKNINSADEFDINELNRRLIAEGLEPITLPAEPEPAKQKPDEQNRQPIETEPEIKSEPAVEHQSHSPTAPEEKSLAEEPEIEVNKTPGYIEEPYTAKIGKAGENYTKQPLIVAASYADCPEPPYPPAAERKGIKGKVILRIRVGANGSPLEVKLISSSGNQMLDRAAIYTVINSWRFKPATRDGVSIESWVEVPITFELGK